jgi:decaprenyl-diphosphate synthase subunit 1
LYVLLQSLQRRALSSVRTQQPGSLPDYQVDPYRLLEDDLKDVYDDIREVS